MSNEIPPMELELVTPEEVQPTPQDYEPQWGQWTRQFITVLLVIATIYALTLLGSIIQILIFSFLIAFLLFVPARFIAHRTRLKFSGSVVIVYFLIIMFIILLVLNFVPSLVQSGRELTSTLERAYNDARTWLDDYTPDQGVITIANVQIDIDPYVQQVRQLFTLLENEEDAPTTPTSLTELFPSTNFNPAAIINFTTSVIAGLLGGITNLLSTLFLALFISFLILIELPTYQRQLLRNVPKPHRREFLLLINKIAHVWIGFFRGQVTLVIVIGVLTWLQLTVMGADSALALAVVVALVSLIPTIGGILALIPLAIVPLIGGSSVYTDMSNVTFALLVVGINLVISQVIWNVVAPKILGDAIALPVPVIILGVFIGAAVGGAIGAFLIVPILGTVRVIVSYLISKIQQRDPYPGEDMPQLTFLARL
jgi:predicted PurR-regulated permease PerM